MTAEPATSYDEVPYADGCFPYTHPDRLAALATLHGLDPPPVGNCRVLELGCALGGNLIPMASGLPEGRFVGIDLSARQIAMARATAEALGLRNIDLRALSIADVDADLGTFDYIICHGVYSWVPAEIREKVLAVCAARLAPNGVAYVSYNTYPGWHARGLVREVMGYHVRRRTEAGDRVRAAREFIDELLGVVLDRQGSYARILKTEAELLRRSGDYYLFHEHLEETNQPCYFHEFIERAAAHGLAFLSEARDGQLENLPPEAREALDGWTDDRVDRQQYLDFLCNRTFRRTLLCREAAAPSAEPDPARLDRLAIRAAARPESANPDIHSDAVETFRVDGALSLSTNHPLVKATLVTLCDAWPKPVAPGHLWETVRARLAEGPAPDPAILDLGLETMAGALTRCFLTGLVDLHAHPARFAGVPGERPSAHPLARQQAAAGRSEVASYRHRTVQLRDFDRLVVSLLDGTLDRPALLEALVDRVLADDTFAIVQDDRPVRDPDAIRELFADEIEPSLRRLAGHALLSET